MTEEKLKYLLDDLSFEEKLGELQQLPFTFFSDAGTLTGTVTEEGLSEEEVNCSGSTLNVFNIDRVRYIQQTHMEKHPHHIPMLFMGDIIHGYSTIFPIPLAQGCSFHPELVQRLAAATAAESCVSGLHITFSPMVDLVRDPRWGRVMESTGEDSYLNSCMAEAAVRGYQGDDLSKEGTISACVKHFAGYGAVEGGREYNSVDISERALRQDYLPAYKAACDAGSGVLMTAFNSLNGVPASGNKKLLHDVLREEWGYDGAVITDYGSIRTMKSHAISQDDAVLAKRAADGDINIEMCSYCYRNGLKTLLAQGEITEEKINALVWRVLQLKNKLGLFENPLRFADKEKAKTVINAPAFMQLAKEAACETSVLLKNDNHILPLSEKSGRLAFIGPYTEETKILGGWVLNEIERPTPQCVKDAVLQRFPNRDIQFAKGCGVLGVEQKREAEFHGFSAELDIAHREEHIAEAVELAQRVDTVVLVLGEHQGTGGELCSRSDITIPTIQKELFRRVYAVNPHIVLVLLNHRPLDLREIADKAQAILTVWFPGTMGAQAITDMLFGEAAPSGRLSMSFPRGVGQVPTYYNHLPTDHSPEFEKHFVTGYIDCPLEPLYPFGYGLSYTEFTYGAVTLDKAVLHEGETLTASVTVTNTGKRDAFETVQMYIRDRYASVSRPVKELKDFRKVWVKAGEMQTVSFTLTPDKLRFYDADMNFVWEPGEIQVFIGKDSTVDVPVSFELV